MFNEQFPRGLITPVDKLSRGYTVTKFFHNYLNQLNVPFYDLCCPEASIFSPVRATDEETLEYFDRDTETWLPMTISGGGGGPTIYSGDDSLAGNRVVDLAGNTLEFSDSGTSLLIDSTLGFLQLQTPLMKTIRVSDDDDQVLLQYDNINNINIDSNGIAFYGAYTFPSTDGIVGQAIVTDGAGILSWGTIIYTVDNGLTENTPGNFQLGGTLLGDTTIDTQSNSLFITGDIEDGPENSIGVLEVHNTDITVSNSAAIRAIADHNTAIYAESAGDGIGNGFGLVAICDVGVGGVGVAATGRIGLLAYGSQIGIECSAPTGGIPLNLISVDGVVIRGTRRPTTGNSVIHPAISLEITDFTPAIGMGQSIDFAIQSGWPTGIQYTNTLVSKWINLGDATRTSQFDITGTGNNTTQTLLSLTGIGALTLPKYGIGTFTGTSTFNLAVDTNGNVIEVAGGGGDSFYTDDGSITSPRTVDLDANNLVITDRGNIVFGTSPTPGSEATLLQATNVTGGTNVSSIDLETTNADATTIISTSFNGGVTSANITLYTDGTDQKITLTGQVVSPTVLANDFPDDATAAIGGVQVAGIYHTSGLLKIRLS